MRDKTRTLLTGEIQVTPFDPIYPELDQMMFLSKKNKELTKHEVRNALQGIKEPDS